MRKVKIKKEYLPWAIAALCFSFLSLLWINFFHQQDIDKKETIASAVQRNSNLAVALEQYTIRTIQNADAVLQLVTMRYQTEGSKIDLEKMIYDNAINRDIIKGLAIVDTEGHLVQLSLKIENPSGIDLSDRDFFKFYKYHDTNAVFISKPVISKTIGKPVIIISRRINKEGHFHGVVALQIEPSTFTSFYAQANLRTHDIISLIAPDGTTYARRTGTIESQGENISHSPLFTHLRYHTDSFYFAKDAIRGIPTWFSYRKLKQYPIIATVGTSEQDVLEDYYKRNKRDLSSTVIISLLIIFFSFLVSLLLMNKRREALRQFDDQQRYQQQLTRQVIAAQERERESIGHELHDNVNQVLTTSKLYLEMALLDKEMKDSLLKKTINLINESISEIRNLSHRLSAPTLGTRSLTDSLGALAEMVSTSSGLKIQFDHSEYKVPLVMDQKLALYRIAQEQLNNVIKHAQAKKVLLTLWQDNNTTFLSIKDDGKGFNNSDEKQGIGINNMISRATVFNGNVEIISAPSRGCTLIVSIPIQRPGQADMK